eukprot:scaffold48800_cov40-Phaeocystis_antarctica.AAC.2
MSARREFEPLVRVRVRVRALVWHTGGGRERLGRPVATAVCAEDGREETELVPAHDELLVRGRALG